MLGRALVPSFSRRSQEAALHSASRLPVSPSSWETLGSLLSFSRPQLSHLQSGAGDDVNPPACLRMKCGSVNCVLDIIGSVSMLTVRITTHTSALGELSWEPKTQGGPLACSHLEARVLLSR